MFGRSQVGLRLGRGGRIATSGCPGWGNPIHQPEAESLLCNVIQ